MRRSVAILRHLASSNRAISAGALVRALEIPRSSVYELLAVLEELGLVAQEGSNLVRTAAGERFLNNPSLAGHEATIHALFADYFSPFVWRQTVEVLRNWIQES